MDATAQINHELDAIQARHGFTDQQLAEYVGVSRWTIYRIRKGDLGETVSTSLVAAILRERTQPIEHAA